MSTTNLLQLLFAALAIIMAGLGLSLRIEDFRRLKSQARGLTVALATQMLVLPLVALSLVFLLKLPPSLAIGLVLLAATPGSISTNLYSHVFGGNVAFNVSLTGLNTFLCALTLPLISGWSLFYFSGTDRQIPLLMGKAVETLAVVFVPIFIGMIVAAKAPRFAAWVAKPVKVASALVVVVFSIVAIVKEWEAMKVGFAQVGASVVVFNVLSMAIGYIVARLSGLGRPERITIMFQVSIHNAILAIYVAMVVLQDTVMALPAAVYSITMNILAISVGLCVSRIGRRKRESSALAEARLRTEAG